MRSSNLSPLLTLCMALELILSPLPVLANDDKIFQQTMNVIQTGAGIYDTIRGGGGQMPPYVSQDMAALRQQQTPVADKHFSLQNMQKIPGLMEYIATQNQKQLASGGKPINPAALNCQTLPTTLYEANNQVCRDREVSPLSGNPQMQAEEAFAYYNQYMQIDKLYQNYSVNSNVGSQAYGIGCMNDAMKILEGFFAYRTEQLDVVVANMEAAAAKFEAQSEVDLRSIRESSAILNGENSSFAAEFKDNDIFNYGKRFENPACNSILSKEKFGDLGKQSGGLLAIENKLKKDLSTTPAGSKYSAEQYIGKHASIEADIKKMADKVATQANLNFSQLVSGGYSNFLGGLSSDVTSESGAHVALNKSLFSDLQRKFTESNKRLSDEARMVASELGNRGPKALEGLADIDNDAAFEAEIGTIENQIKSECISRSGVDQSLGRIFDPNLSKEANKVSASQLSKRIRAIMADDKRNPEDKLKELKTIEGIDSGRFQLKMDDGYEVTELTSDGKVVKRKKSADGNTPYAFIKDIMNNCESQFQVNKLGNKLSGKEALKRLRTLKQDYKKSARQHAKDIKDEVIKKMIHCDGNNEVANSLSVNSCGPEKFNMAGPGFCAKGAFSCAKNLQSCSEKAQKFVKEIKDDRLVRVTNYNNNVELNRRQIVGMFDTAMVKYMQEAEALRAHFGTGFTPPKDITRDLSGGRELNPEYRGDPGDQLKIKDPKAYLKMVKDNLSKLKTQVEDQQKGIIGPNGTLAGHIKQTQDNYKNQVLSKAKALAQDCLAAHNSFKSMMKAQKEASDAAQGELGEKNGSLCSMYTRIMSDNPNGACKEDIVSTGSAALQAAGKSGGNTAEINFMIRQMEARCANLPQESSSAAEICTNDQLPENFKEKFKNTQKYSFNEACDVVTNPKSSHFKALCEVEEISKIHTTTTTPTGPEPTGEPRDKESGSQCPGVWTKTDADTTKNTFSQTCTKPGKADCSKIEQALVASYSNSLKRGDLYTESAATPAPATCAASFNGGPFNTKGGFGPEMSNNPLNMGSNALGY